jgi:hypothetical protein
MDILENKSYNLGQISQTRTIIVLATVLLSSLFLHFPELSAQKFPSTSSISTISNSTTLDKAVLIPDSLSLVNCSLGKTPSDPVDMNTVVFKDIAKTIHVEKEVFTCKTKNGASVVALVSLYTELFENMNSFKPLNKVVEAITCVKGFNGTVSYCKSKSVPLSNNLVYLNCDPRVLRTLPLSLPIEMETVVSSEGIAKTVESEKEVFLCDLKQNIPTKLLDVNLFTEIFEDIVNGKVLKKSVESVTCQMDIATASILKCGTLRHL